MKIIFSPSFAKKYKKLPEQIKDLAEKKFELFVIDPFDSQLKTHKLHGSLDDLYAFSINQKYRIVFDFQDKHSVTFHFVGSHDIY